MPKFHVVLDTNIYRKNPSRMDLAFQALERLCKNKIVKLHLPYIVEREFQTQQVALYKREVDAAIAGLDALLRKGLSSELCARTQKIRDELFEASPNILGDAENAILVWADSIGAQRHAITESQAISAMESYFVGTAPLKSPKIRDDIPDSFIFQTISHLSTHNNPLIVIAEDGKLSQASEVLAGIRVFKSLSDFIESEEIQNEILELDVIANLSVLRDVIKEFERASNTISNAIGSEGGKALDWRTVHSQSIPDDNNEATITGFGDPTNIDLGFDEIFYFGCGEFGIPFSFSATVMITYYIFKPDYYCLDEDKMPSVSNHNDHYYEAEEEVEVNVIGLVKVTIEQSELKTISAATLDEYIEVSIDSIDSIELDR